MNKETNTHEREVGDIEFIRLREVKRITSLGSSSIYEKMKTGDFPSQIKLGPRAVAWIKAEVQTWAHAQVARSRLTVEVEQPDSLQPPD
nr:AlpA family phage regulatory protein [uncultured Pseudomonas sp.]